MKREHSLQVGRDPRVDLLRGAALLMIFVDHVPGNVLGEFTLRNFGFADAAELFVIMAGYSAMAAYGRVFAQRGFRAGCLKVFSRCCRLYGVQLLLLLVTLITVLAWTRSAGYEAIIVGPMLRDGVHGAMRGVRLAALPAYLDILPLYLILIAGFPLVYAGLTLAPRTSLAVSGIVYAGANIWHVNLVNRVDPANASHWMFNPFAWQLVFVIGAALALVVAQRGPLRRSPWLGFASLCYLAFGLAAIAPWRLWPNDWLKDLPLSIFGNDPKVYVSPLRLLDALAIVYLALTSQRLMRLANARALAPLMWCGRHSLEIFAAGTMLSLLGRLAFRTWGTGVPLQIAVNITGFGILLVLSYMLESRQSKWRASGPKAEATLPDYPLRRTV